MATAGTCLGAQVVPEAMTTASASNRTYYLLDSRWPADKLSFTMAGDLTNRVKAALAHVPRVEEKKMFGGTAFMVRGKMCVTAREERIMCRIDPAIHDAALERKGCRTVVMNGRQYRGYVHVDAAALRTKRDLEYWVGLALDYNKRAKASNRKRS